MTFRFLQWYNMRLKTHPWLTNCTSGFVIAFIGDILAQTVVRKRTSGRDPSNLRVLDPSSSEDDAALLRNPLLLQFSKESGIGLLDLRRTFIFAAYSFTIGTPMWGMMYNKLDVIIKKHTICAALKKGVCTWIFGFVTTPVLICYIKSVEVLCMRELRHPKSQAEWDASLTRLIGLRIREEVLVKMQSDFALLQIFGLLYWSLHWIPLFYLLPHHVRLVYSSVCTAGWIMCQSFILHRDNKDTVINRWIQSLFLKQKRNMNN